jgi:hypothetical protein
MLLSRENGCAREEADEDGEGEHEDMTAIMARMIASSSWSNGWCATGGGGACCREGRAAVALSSVKDPEEPPLSSEWDRFDESDDEVDEGSTKRPCSTPPKKPVASMSAMPSTYTQTSNLYKRNDSTCKGAK